MKFTIVPSTSTDTSLAVDQLVLPALTPLPGAVRTRKVSLNEEDSEVLAGVDPRAALLGTVDDAGNPVPLRPDDPLTENPGVNDTEIWEMHNFTEDAHPIHLHQVMFEVVNRQALVTDADGMVVTPAQLTGDPWENGFKDTVIVYPGQVTRIKAKFDIAGNYVWHCHILEHENNHMMRPFQVGT